MKETPVQLLKRILEGQKDEPFDYDEWCISLEYAEDTEKEQMEEIREMLVQGALTNMSCASAVVEFDKLTKNKEMKKQKIQENEFTQTTFSLKRKMNWWREQSCEGDKGGSFNLDLYLDYLSEQEFNEIQTQDK